MNSYVDFLSMYRTVNSLMGLWRYVIAREIRVVRHCRTSIIKLLRRQQRPLWCLAISAKRYA